MMADAMFRREQALLIVIGGYAVNTLGNHRMVDRHDRQLGNLEPRLPADHQTPRRSPLRMRLVQQIHVLDIDELDRVAALG